MVIYLDENMIVEAKKTELKLRRNATGYGKQMPTCFMIKLDRGARAYWHRVFAICYSNAASYYIKAGAMGERFLDSECFERIESLMNEGVKS